jgi:hypothetical protein
MQVRRIVLHRKGEKLRDINRHLRLLNPAVQAISSI